ncbi:unnamed protein product [Rotaria sp. Silwood2]|nr:unnamed protein product [Rotaria sp. Silwood2]
MSSCLSSCITKTNTNTIWLDNSITVTEGNNRENGSNQLDRPRGICIDDDEQVIYIVDTSNHRIIEWKYGSPNGQIVASGNRAGKRTDQLNNPTYVVVDKRKDCLIICDHGNRRVVRWPRRNGINGEIIITDVDGTGLTINNDGYFYISDYEKHEVRRWRTGNTNGTVVAGSHGQDNRLDQLNSSGCIVIDKDYSVYISDEYIFQTSNPLNEFILEMQNLPYAEKIYPVSTYLLKRLDDYTNIQHLYPIVTFSNYLIEKLNHRIKRIDAVQTKMIYYLTQDNDRDITKKLFEDFLDAWYALTFKEVRYGCQTPKFEHVVSKEKFAENTSIAMLLLTSSRDDSILLPACLKTIAELQNEIVNYFQNTIETTTKTKQQCVPLQSIRPEHIFSLDRNDLNRKLINDSLVLNYQYGKSKDIIYDYEEMEITLRNMISKLVLIDTDKLNFLTYQFELYGENTSLINEVRARIKQQQQLTNDDRTKLNSLINTMNHDDILHYLGSLDNIFTYIRTIAVEKLTEDMTIQLFV